jgi:hypothetical protein
MVQRKRAPVKKTNICELKLVPEGARSNFCCSFFCVFALHEALVKKVDLRALQSSIRRQLRWVSESGCRKRRAKEFSVLAPRRARKRLTWSTMRFCSGRTMGGGSHSTCGSGVTPGGAKRASTSAAELMALWERAPCESARPQHASCTWHLDMCLAPRQRTARCHL